MVLVSACLLGVKCRYDGGGLQIEALLELAAKGQLLPVCPEQLGGCSTPRVQCEIKGGDGAGVLEGGSSVVGKSGEDLTEEFLKGAQETLKIAKACGVEKAILKANSPSCGFGMIYDGTFTGEKVKGNGVAAELLSRNGIAVYTEEMIDALGQV